MIDWRKIEASLVTFARDEGFAVTEHPRDGYKYAVIAEGETAEVRLDLTYLAKNLAEDLS